MAQFSVAGMRHQIKDEAIKQFYDDWVISVSFNQVLKQAFLEYYLSGQAYPMKTLVNPEIKPDGNSDFKYKVEPSLQKQSTKADIKKLNNINKEYTVAFKKYLENEIEYEEMKDIHDDCIKRTNAAKKHVWSKSMIPGMYTMLDPKLITMKGPESFGLAEMHLRVSQELIEAIKNPTKEQKQMIINLPKDFVSQIKKGNSTIVLDPNIVSRVTRMKPDYEPLAFPLMHRAFRALHMKNRLREMDSATIDTIITQMVIVKIGNDKYPAKPSHLQALSKAWADAVRSKSLTLFWNHTIEVERIPVEIDVLNQEKYEVWNNDIRDAFGVSPVLLGRVEGSSTTGYVSVKGFIENLEQGRQDLLEQFIYPEYHGIAVAMGFEGYPEVVFDKFNLQDEASVKDLLIKFVQNGILSYNTVIEELGYSYKQELERMTLEAPLKDDGTIRIMSPNTNATDSVEGGRPKGDAAPPSPTKKPGKTNKDKNVNSK
jgi:hypothetical protein